MIRNIFCRDQRRTDAGVGESEGLYPVLTPPTQMCNSPFGTFSGIHLESWLSNPDPGGIRKSATTIQSTVVSTAVRLYIRQRLNG